MSGRSLTPVLPVCAVLAFAACGPGVVVTTAGPAELRAALYASSEELTVTPIPDRSRLYDALGVVASDEATRAVRDAPVLFPMAGEQGILAAPFNPSLDLLKPPVSAPDVELIDGQEKWSDDLQPGLLGATEREIANLVARSLLAQWKVTGRVTVVRSSGFPYAAAFVDGQLRLNPAVLYLAVAHAAPQEAAQSSLALPLRTPPESVSRESTQSSPAVDAADAPVRLPPANAGLESLAQPSAPVAGGFPISPLGTAAGLVAAGMIGSWVLIRRR